MEHRTCDVILVALGSGEFPHYKPTSATVWYKDSNRSVAMIKFILDDNTNSPTEALSITIDSLTKGKFGIDRHRTTGPAFFDKKYRDKEYVLLGNNVIKCKGT